MTYSIIQPPFTLKFAEMSREQLKAYRAWFMEIMPARLTELERAVKTDPRFAEWKRDLTRTSVEDLGLWFADQVESRPRTPEEIQEITGKLTFEVEVSPRELTNRTFSLAMDVGMYLGEVFVMQFPNLRWDQALKKSKRYAHFGQMVVTGFGPMELNPVWITVTFCYGIARDQRTGRRLVEVFDYWAAKAQEG